MKSQILVIEDDLSLQNVLLESINSEGHTAVGVKSAEDAIELFEKGEKFDVILTDVNLPGQSGLDILPICIQHNPDAFLLVMTGYGTIDTAVKAMKLGATDFLCKPIALRDLFSAIRVASEKLKNRTEDTIRDKPEIKLQNPTESPIIAESEIMLNLLEQLKTIAPFKINALVTGETGTGKELIAREIHRLSPRVNYSFVALNCAAVPKNLLEDELFGHIKGAFTGANNDRKGRFEQADGGTLFLDEIGDMDMALQAKLLRVLQESEFEKLGSSETVKVDVRIVAATSSNLEEKIEDGSFRADLFHRLNVVHLRVPALRERPDDVRPLAEGLLKRFCDQTGLPEKIIDDEVFSVLDLYGFPGNVRQLQNCMERGAVFSGAGDELKLEHLPEEVKNQTDFLNTHTSKIPIPTSIPDEGIDLSDVVSQVEKELLLQTLDKTGGNKMQAAKLLNMKRTTLVEKVKRLQLEEKDDSDRDDEPISKVG